MGPELEAIDSLLDDPRFLAPFVERFFCRVCRRLIVVAAVLSHRVAQGPAAPDDPDEVDPPVRAGLVEDLNRARLERAVEGKLLRGRRLRIDTTCVEADVRYPTDSGLCAHAVSRLTRAVGRVKAAGLAARTAFRDRRRSAEKAVRRLSGALGRGGNSRPAVDRETRVLHDLAVRAARDAGAGTCERPSGTRPGGAQGPGPSGGPRRRGRFG